MSWMFARWALKFISCLKVLSQCLHNSLLTSEWTYFRWAFKLTSEPNIFWHFSQCREVLVVECLSLSWYDFAWFELNILLQKSQLYLAPLCSYSICFFTWLAVMNCLSQNGQTLLKYWTSSSLRLLSSFCDFALCLYQDGLQNLHFSWYSKW